MLTILLKCSVHDTRSACYTLYDVSVGQLQVQFQHCLKSLIDLTFQQHIVCLFNDAFKSSDCLARMAGRLVSNKL